MGLILFTIVGVGRLFYEEKDGIGNEICFMVVVLVIECDVLIMVVSLGLEEFVVGDAG